MTERILAFDTSGPYCAVALAQSGQITHHASEDMARGQAERLMGLLQETLDHENLAWADLDALAVGVGPGNFTGIRISVSAARGLALALGIPAIGVSTFQAFAPPVGPSSMILPAPRDMVYLQHLDGLDPTSEPKHTRLSEAAQVGDGSTQISLDSMGQTIAPRIATVGRALFKSGRFDMAKPLYVKAPDAAPPRDPAPTILP